MKQNNTILGVISVFQPRGRNTIFCAEIDTQIAEGEKEIANTYMNQQWRIQDFHGNGATPKVGISYKFLARKCMKMKELLL